MISLARLFDLDAVLNVSPVQVKAAIEYIEAHWSEVHADYQKIVERHARGNPPELLAKANYAKLSHAKLLAHVAQRRRKQPLESSGAQDSG